jgi:hypothetical protein
VLSALMLLWIGAAPDVAGPRSSGGSQGAGGKQIVRLRFTRSGGFAAAPGMTVSGVVDLDRNGGRVSADDGSYLRTLSSGEAKKLREIAPAAITRLHSHPGPPTSAQADQYQYEITVESSDGRESSATLAERAGTDSNEAGRSVAEVLAWVRQESERIWRHRVEKR